MAEGKAEMKALDARRKELEVQLKAADEPPQLLHPSMADLYRTKVEELAELCPLDILDFCSRVLVNSGAARGGYAKATLSPDTVLSVYSCDHAVRFSGRLAARRTRSRWSERGQLSVVMRRVDVRARLAGR